MRRIVGGAAPLKRDPCASYARRGVAARIACAAVLSARPALATLRGFVGVYLGDGRFLMDGPLLVLLVALGVPAGLGVAWRRRRRGK